MRIEEVRLGWDESQKHYLSISDIEEKHLPDSVPMNKNQKKKALVKIHNDTNEYLRVNELIAKMGGFYKTVVTSED